jgi:hypothetical protein
MATVEIGPFNVTGELSANVNDPAGAPINVLRSNQAWSVDCSWFLDGNAGQAIGGSWRIKLIAEGQGLDIEGQTVPQVIALDGRVGAANPYTASFQFGPNSVPLGGDAEAVLDLTVVLTHVDLANTPGPLAAFVDLDKVMVYAAD